MLDKLRKEVCKANIELVKYGLVILTWGNVSGIDRKKGLVVIKPSGVNYDRLTPGDMVVVDLNGEVVDGKKRPSSDTPTHVELYKKFPEIGGITHTHSTYATSFAQASKEIPCLGTTHADQFHGPVPVTRMLSKTELKNAYELNTGRVIVERFKSLDYTSIPGILVSGHGPFCWGEDAADSARNALILERIAEMAFMTIQIDTGVIPLPKHIMDKHHTRKHGRDAYYGQKK